MRALLEFLGMVEPAERRRDPVALPAWARRLGLVLVAALATASTLVLALARALAR
jgi:hypothetical protein